MHLYSMSAEGHWEGLIFHPRGKYLLTSKDIVCGLGKDLLWPERMLWGRQKLRTTEIFSISFLALWFCWTEWTKHKNIILPVESMQPQDTTKEKMYNSGVVFAWETKWSWNQMYKIWYFFRMNKARFIMIITLTHWGAVRVRMAVQSPQVKENKPNEWYATLIILGTGSVSVRATAKPTAQRERIDNICHSKYMHL